MKIAGEGSPFEERTRFWSRALLISSTLNCFGMVSTVGILYVHVLSWMTMPSEFVLYSSFVKKPTPWMNAPSTWVNQEQCSEQHISIGDVSARAVIIWH